MRVLGQALWHSSTTGRWQLANLNQIDLIRVDDTDLLNFQWQVRNDLATIFQRGQDVKGHGFIAFAAARNALNTYPHIKPPNT